MQISVVSILYIFMIFLQMQLSRDLTPPLFYSFDGMNKCIATTEMQAIFILTFWDKYHRIHNTLAGNKSFQHRIVSWIDCRESKMFNISLTTMCSGLIFYQYTQLVWWSANHKTACWANGMGLIWYASHISGLHIDVLAKHAFTMEIPYLEISHRYVILLRW